MSNGIRSLPRYQEGDGEKGGIASLIQGIRRNNPLSKLRRLAPLFLGERSETGLIEGPHGQRISEAIYNTISPYGYSDKEDQLRLAMQRIARGERGLSPRGDRLPWWHERELGPPTTETIYDYDPDHSDDPGERRRRAYRYRTSDPLEDAWRMYLGLDQLYDSFKESEFRPTISTGEDIRYQDFVSPESRASLSKSWHDDVYPVRDRRYGNSAMDRELEWRGTEPRRTEIDAQLTDLWRLENPSTSDIEERLKLTKEYEGLEERRDSSAAYIDQGYPTIRNLITQLDDSGTVHQKDPLLNTYTLSKGEDERGPYVSYYDKWDLVPEVKGINVANISRAGRPFDIYGRMYYDPETYELFSGSRGGIASLRGGQ